MDKYRLGYMDKSSVWRRINVDIWIRAGLRKSRCNSVLKMVIRKKVRNSAGKQKI